MYNLNERIMEIAESVDEKAWCQQHPDDDKWCVEFGERIIQECVKIIYDHGKTYDFPGAGFHSADGFANAIKKEFKLNNDNALRV